MISVRRATTANDWEAASALLSEYVDSIRVGAGFDPLVEQPSFAAELESLPARYGGAAAALYIAYDGGVPVGTAAVCCDGHGDAELKRMYVSPTARGRGVADALISAAVAAASAHGCRQVWLESMPGVMDAAIAVYRRNGFAASQDRPRTLALDGVLVMERALAPAAP